MPSIFRKRGKKESVQQWLYSGPKTVIHILRNSMKIKGEINYRSLKMNSYSVPNLFTHFRPCTIYLSLYNLPSHHHAHLMKMFNIGWPSESQTSPFSITITPVLWVLS